MLLRQLNSIGLSLGAQFYLQFIYAQVYTNTTWGASYSIHKIRISYKIFKDDNVIIIRDNVSVNNQLTMQKLKIRLNH